VITITGFGDHNQPEWLIIFTGIRTDLPGLWRPDQQSHQEVRLHRVG